MWKNLNYFIKIWCFYSKFKLQIWNGIPQKVKYEAQLSNILGIKTWNYEKESQMEKNQLDDNENIVSRTACTDFDKDIYTLLISLHIIV